MNPWCLAGNLQVNLHTSGIHLLEQAKAEVDNLVVIPVYTNLQPLTSFSQTFLKPLVGA